MKYFVIKAFEGLCHIGFFVVIAVAAYGGHEEAPGLNLEPWFGALLGGIAGLVAAIFTFGLLFLIMDIADNARRTRAIWERVSVRLQ